jgi:rare lipoprotein A
VSLPFVNRALASHALRVGALTAAALALTACMSQPRYSIRPEATAPPSHAHGTMQPYRVGGQWYYPSEQPRYDETGYASWYGGGDGYACQMTADGETMDPSAITGAHKTLPLPSYVEVTNLENGKRVKVRVNDRGPFVKGRIIDLSHAAAERLGFFGKGLVKVRVQYLGPAPMKATEASWHASGECR